MLKQPTREKLLDITFDEVYIHGYAATSVDTILKKAGIPKGSMYHYFKGKKALVLAMVQERLFPKMEAFFDFSPREGLEAYWEKKKPKKPKWLRDKYNS
jgi:TetR/AcrR family transcriptional repressor of nem operon